MRSERIEKSLKHITLAEELLHENGRALTELIHPHLAKRITEQKHLPFNRFNPLESEVSRNWSVQLIIEYLKRKVTTLIWCFVVQVYFTIHLFCYVQRNEVNIHSILCLSFIFTPNLWYSWRQFIDKTTGRYGQLPIKNTWDLTKQIKTYVTNHN